MKVVVPLAGPDFEGTNGQTKSELLIDGLPLLRRTLESRPWWVEGTVRDRDFVFVLRDSEISRRFHRETLKRWYPCAKSVFVSNWTRGAAFSSLAGMSLVETPEQPLCVDLADIVYEAVAGHPLFPLGRDAAGRALVFQSSNTAYSYFRTDGDGRVVEVAEKRVISTHASAGTYLFASIAAYLSALAANLARPSAVEYRGAFYVAPVFQGLIDLGLRVELAPVRLLRDPKMSAMSPPGALPPIQISR